MAEGFAKTPVFAKVPRYVLRDGAHPTCPSVFGASPVHPVTVVFGFSDKPEYDVFLKASPLALTPYPLVKGYLQNQISLENKATKLVAVDAASPHQLAFHAATMEAVLESFQLGMDQVAITHQLILDEFSNHYRVQILADATPERFVP